MVKINSRGKRGDFKLSKEDREAIDKMRQEARKNQDKK